MNEVAANVAAPRGGLQGLPQRLVADGLVNDAAMLDAVSVARERRVSIVSYLVEYNLADARGIAIAASLEFGAPLLDLDSLQPDLDTVRIVSEKILRKHRVLPLVKRGKKLFIAISDPTNLHALDEVKFATGFSIEAVVVEEDKLGKLLSVALEQVVGGVVLARDDDPRRAHAVVGDARLRHPSSRTALGSSGEILAEPRAGGGFPPSGPAVSRARRPAIRSTKGSSPHTAIWRSSRAPSATPSPTGRPEPGSPASRSSTAPSRCRRN